MSFVPTEVASAAQELVSGFDISTKGFRSVGHLAMQHDPDLASHFMSEISRLEAEGSDNPAVAFVVDFSDMLRGSGMSTEDLADRVTTVVLGHTVKLDFSPQIAGPEHWANTSRHISV